MAASAEGSSSENNDWLAVRNWPNVEKEREREKRRMRDRERRQSMSEEQRERHLARRRRNYQLRRQRASLMSSCPPPLPPLPSQTRGIIIPRTRSIFHQCDETIQLECIEKDHERLLEASLSTMSSSHPGGAGQDATTHVKYPYPEGLHFYQIKHFARLLNSPSGEAHDHIQHVEAQVSAKGCDSTTISKCKLRRRVRLIDLKRLARALNSAPKGEKVELMGHMQIICSKSVDEPISEVQQINAYSGVFAP
ncbi:unnamed protein product [Cuscuta epithymum]|nr:unnamed protein product [Cuscuta epithymum]